MYYKRDAKNLAQGQCRRLPPSVIVIPTRDAMGNQVNVVQAFHPPLTPDSWCGEHTPGAAPGEVIQ